MLPPWMLAKYLVLYYTVLLVESPCAGGSLVFPVHHGIRLIQVGPPRCRGSWDDAHPCADAYRPLSQSGAAFNILRLEAQIGNSDLDEFVSTTDIGQTDVFEVCYSPKACL